MIAAVNTIASTVSTNYPEAAGPTLDPTGAPSLGAHVRNLVTKLVAQAKKIQVRQNKKRLRVCETVALGDKRFVAVIQVDNQQFLLGGSSTSVSLLAHLETPAEFASVLQARIAEVKP